MFKLTILFLALIAGQPTPIIKAKTLELYATKEACETAAPAAEKSTRELAMSKAALVNQTLIGASFTCEKSKGTEI